MLHAPTEARHSLALDLAEPFKPVLTDTLVIEAVLRRQVEPSWFHQEDGACRLSEAGRQQTLQLWAAKTETTGRDGRSLAMTIRAEALALERHVLGLGAYKPFARSV